MKIHFAWSTRECRRLCPPGEGLQASTWIRDCMMFITFENVVVHGVCFSLSGSESLIHIISVRLGPKIRGQMHVKLSLRMAAEVGRLIGNHRKNFCPPHQKTCLAMFVCFLPVVKLPGKQYHNHKVLWSLMMKNKTVMGSRALVSAQPEGSVLVGKPAWEARRNHVILVGRDSEVWKLKELDG